MKKVLYAASFDTRTVSMVPEGLRYSVFMAVKGLHFGESQIISLISS